MFICQTAHVTISQICRPGISAQPAATCAVLTSLDLGSGKMAQPASQPPGMKHKDAIELPERIPSSSESSRSESETPSTWSSSEGEPNILCRYCFGSVELNSSQPLECGSCGMQFHFNCYNAHLPCGRIHVPMEADEVLQLPYAEQGRGMRRARGRDENQLTRRVRVDQ